MWANSVPWSRFCVITVTKRLSAEAVPAPMAATPMAAPVMAENDRSPQRRRAGTGSNNVIAHHALPSLGFRAPGHDPEALSPPFVAEAEGSPRIVAPWQRLPARQYPTTGRACQGEAVPSRPRPPLPAIGDILPHHAGSNNSVPHSRTPFGIRRAQGWRKCKQRVRAPLRTLRKCVEALRSSFCSVRAPMFGCGGSHGVDRASGKALFAEDCSGCHSLVGNDALKRQGGDLLGYRYGRRALIQFVHDMPARRPLDSGQVTSIVAYVSARERSAHGHELADGRLRFARARLARRQRSRYPARVRRRLIVLAGAGRPNGPPR